MPPPAALVKSLVEGPSVLSGVEWHEEVGSTNALAAQAATRGVPEVHAVLADLQTAGRGRRGRSWTAPAGTSLLLSLLVRPAAQREAVGLLPLMTGLALVEAVEERCPGLPVALKWPNDLLVGGRKAAGILVEALGGACVVGVGVNVDWRGVHRPPELAGAVSLAEAGCEADRWRLFAALVERFGGRYQAWRGDPAGFLPDYRARCSTLGTAVRVTGLGADPLEGTAEGMDPDGALRVRDRSGRTVRVVAGQVEHVRPG
jgi:BirA family biotin operon repressor/biotin-[acetyl-CoA-carboxylase] ligase